MRLTPAQLVRRQVVVEDHAPLPDGSAAIVVVRRVRGNAYTSNLRLVPFSRRVRPTRLTSGPVRDTNPQVSPDGRRIAFLRRLSDVAGSPSALMLLDLPGGRPRSIWSAPHGISELAWSPDGSRLAIVAPAEPPRFLVGSAGRDRAGSSPTARRVLRIDWRWDEVGHRDRWDHAWVLPARPGARPRQVTSGEFDVKGLSWAADGVSLLYGADPGVDADVHPRPSIWAVPAAGGEPHEVVVLAGYAGSPACSPDGRWIACVGVDVANPTDDEQPGIFVGPADGSAPAVALAPDLDRPVGALVDTDLNGWMASARSGPWWVGTQAVVALVSEGGRARPWRFGFDPIGGRPVGEPRRLLDADATAWSVGAAGPPGHATISLVATLDDRPMELMTIAPGASASARPLTWTREGSAWRRGLPWPEMRRVVAPGPGGDIETWIASPHEAADQPLPAIIDVHGGPLGAWAPAPSLEVVLLCARGFRVILPNIRGSAGYGRAWIAPQLGDWGGADAADVLAAVDHAVALGLADPARLGVLGLSYGGFMVNWLVGAEPDRFAGAVSENGVTNQVSAWANSDSGPEYNRAARLGDALSEDGVARLWRQSPLRNVSRMRTPLLMLQAEADLRCPPQDNEQLFVALRLLGRTVEYILYPESHHTFAVTGRPDRRIDRHERMLAWFERHLGGDRAAPAERP